MTATPVPPSQPSPSQPSPSQPSPTGSTPSGRRAALVTGATAGIGNAFARELAARGHDLVLVARDGERLARVAEQLRAAHGVVVEVLVADLTEPAALQRVANRLRDADRPIDLLVNNAGFSTAKRFVDSDLDSQLAQLDVLVRAVLVLSHAALPGMITRGRGGLITVSSVAGFLLAGSYSAAKAWATTFTVSLNAELTGTGVHALALCPGFVRTEFHQRMGLRQEGPSWAWLDADRLVRDSLRDLAAGRVLSVPSRRYRALVFAVRHLPLPAQLTVGRVRSRMRAKAAR